MREFAASLAGVPGVILLSAGLGIVAVTLASRLRQAVVRPIRWAHLVLGVGLTGAGALLLELGVTVQGGH